MSALVEGLASLGPWVTGGGLVAATGVAAKLWVDLKRLEMESRNNAYAAVQTAENSIRDHYAQEVASLRGQLLAMAQTNASSLALAEQRYREAIAAADERHSRCEQECEALREQVRGMEREIGEMAHRLVSLDNRPVVRVLEAPHENPRMLEQKDDDGS